MTSQPKLARAEFLFRKAQDHAGIDVQGNARSDGIRCWSGAGRSHAIIGLQTMTCGQGGEPWRQPSARSIQVPRARTACTRQFSASADLTESSSSVGRLKPVKNGAPRELHVARLATATKRSNGARRLDAIGVRPEVAPPRFPRNGLNKPLTWHQ